MFFLSAFVCNVFSFSNVCVREIFGSFIIWLYYDDT